MWFSSLTQLGIYSIVANVTDFIWWRVITTFIIPGYNHYLYTTRSNVFTKTSFKMTWFKSLKFENKTRKKMCSHFIATIIIFRPWQHGAQLSRLVSNHLMKLIIRCVDFGLKITLVIHQMGILYDRHFFFNKWITSQIVEFPRRKKKLMWIEKKILPACARIKERHLFKTNDRRKKINCSRAINSMPIIINNNPIENSNKKKHAVENKRQQEIRFRVDYRNK